jgi:photosynthetic reaction center cytochrome c subunit
LFWLVFVAVTFTLVFAGWWVIYFVSNTVLADEEPESARSPIHVDFRTNVDDYISAESYLAMGEYARIYPEPRNVQVLTDLTTQEINGYMMNHIVAGMSVNCTYCHSLANFAADEWGDPVAEANKMTARRHLQMSADLNQNWLTQLPDLTPQKAPSGVQVSCVICHNGVAVPNNWPEDLQSLPDGFRLPLNMDAFASYPVDLDVDESELSLSLDDEGLLNVNGRTDIGLERVQYNQYVMYHMNRSMNVGCTHCHNSRYFPSREVPAIYYASNMLQMTQYILEEYGDTFSEGNEPNCLMCHQERVIPPGSVLSPDLLPDSLTAASADDS